MLDLVKDEQNRTLAANRDSVRRAVRLLGEMRATEAVDILAEFVDLDDMPMVVSAGGGPNGVVSTSKDPVLADHYNAPLGTWSTVAALVKIGEPSIPAVVKRLAKATAGDMSLQMGGVLLELKGA